MHCTVYGLGCCSSSTAALKKYYNIGWECIPLDKSQWEEGVFIAILTSMNLTECHGMAISGDPMCELYVHVARKGHNHEAVYDFVKETETDHISSLFKGLPIQLRQQCSDTNCSGKIM